MAAFLLLAAWLPATLHCRIETAGLLDQHHEDCSESKEVGSAATDCRDDICPTVESTLFKDTADAPLVTAPAAACAICAALVARASDNDPTAGLSPERHHPPPGLAVGWQFIARAAPPSRAPTPNV